MIPIYVDTSFVIFGSIWRKLRKIEKNAHAEVDVSSVPWGLVFPNLALYRFQVWWLSRPYCDTNPLPRRLTSLINGDDCLIASVPLVGNRDCLVVGPTRLETNTSYMLHSSFRFVLLLSFCQAKSARYSSSTKTHASVTRDTANKDEERTFTNRYIRRTWIRLWCTMLRKNSFVCFRDTAAGVKGKTRAPTVTTTAQTGPFPSLNPGAPEGSQSSRLGSKKSIGTANVPVIVRSPQSKAIGRNTNAWGVMRTSPSGTLTRRPGSSASSYSDGGERVATD